MFDAGFWELLVIGVLALIVVGPERLPRLARTVGLWVGRARHAFYSVRDEIEREANAQGLRETEQAIRRSMEQTQSEVRAQLDSVSQEGRDAAQAAEQTTREAAGGAEGKRDGGGADTNKPQSAGKDSPAGTPQDPSDSKHG